MAGAVDRGQDDRLRSGDDLVLLAVGFGLAGIVGGVLVLPFAAIARDLFAYTFRTAQAESAVVADA